MYSFRYFMSFCICVIRTVGWSRLPVVRFSPRWFERLVRNPKGLSTPGEDKSRLAHCTGDQPAPATRRISPLVTGPSIIRARIC